MTCDSSLQTPGVFRANRTPESGVDLGMSASIGMPPHLHFHDGELLYVSGEKTTLKAAMKRYSQFRDSRRPPEEEFWILMPLVSYPEVKLSGVFPLGFSRLPRSELEAALESGNCIRHPEMLKMVMALLDE